MRLTLISFDLKPGDVVLAKGNYRDKTVALVVPTSDKDVMVTWTCGGQTRYNAMTELDVWRVCKHEEQVRGVVKSEYGWPK